MAMTALPVIMSEPMVRSLLREAKEPGTGKQMTRRLAWRMDCGKRVEWSASLWQRVKPGDRLWVRENFSVPHSFKGKPSELSDGPIWYWADGNPEHGDWSKPKPSIHLPRAWSRITLVVTATKIERLQNISNEDACAEGFSNPFMLLPDAIDKRLKEWPAFVSPRDAFAHFWRHLHGPQAWDDNPWVVATSFDVHACNIDGLFG